MKRLRAVQAATGALLLRATEIPLVIRLGLALIRRGHPAARSIPVPTLTKLALDPDKSLRSCVGAAHGPALTPREILERAADRPELVGDLAVVFGIVDAAPGERGVALHDAIVLDQAAGRARLHAALLAVRRAPNEITIGQGRAIFKRCLSLISQPIDPYEPDPLSFAARTAAAALLESDSALDAMILEQIREARLARELAIVYGAGIQGSRSQLGERLSAGLKALSPTRDAALAFARDSDRRFSALGPAVAATRGLQALSPVLRRARLRVEPARLTCAGALQILLPLAVGVGAALAFNSFIVGLPADVRVSPAAALTGFGILVAVHVLSAQLSAERLPGLIAQKISFPLTLATGYVGTLALAILGATHPRKSTATTISHVEIGLVAALVAVLLAALLSLIARLDPVRAVISYERRERSAMQRAGRQVGSLQQAALTGRALLSSMPWSHQTLSEPKFERHETLRAPRDGYLRLRARQVRKLAKKPGWADERVRMHLVAPLGSRVPERLELVSVVPADDDYLHPADVRLARRLVTVTPRPAVDRTTEVASVLLTLAWQLAEAGNAAGGDSVATALVRLIEVHLDAMRVERGGASSDASVGMVPLLRTVATHGARLLETSATGSSRDVVLGFIDRLLQLTDQADSCAAFLALQVRRHTSQARDWQDSVELLLWSCGCRAVETGDDLGFRTVRDKLAAGPNGAAPLSDLSGRLLQFAALNRPSLAERHWRWHLKEIGVGTSQHVLIALRAGASSLLAGGAVVALNIALDLPAMNGDVWRTYFEDHAVADRELIRSNLYGQLLGADPQRALEDFVSFASRAQRAVKEN